MNLLYAEDEPALSEAVVDYLTYHKSVVDAVYDGEEAYDYAMSGKYDGIILDIMMPKRDGLEVLSALRRNGCRTPVLLLTAKTQVEDRIRGLDTGIIDNAYHLISSYVEKDPTAFYTFEEFETGVETMRQFCALRSESISMQLANEETASDMSYVDASSLTLSDMGSMGGKDGFGQ